MFTALCIVVIVAGIVVIAATFVASPLAAARSLPRPARGQALHRARRSARQALAIALFAIVAGVVGLVWATAGQG
jgi:hypothetical protein